MFWPYLTSGHGGGISPVLWTLVLEVHFYVIYALSLPILRRCGFAGCAIALLAAAVLYRLAWTLYAMDQLGLPRFFAPYVFSPLRFGEWLLGAWVAETYARGGIVPFLARAGGPARSIGLGIAIIMIAIPLGAVLGGADHSVELPAAIGFTFVLLGAIGVELNGSSRSSRRGPWQVIGSWLGERSYSLYLVHFTVLVSVVEAWARIAHISDKDTLAGTGTAFALVSVGLLLTLAVTELSYRLIERPSHEIGRRLARTARGGRIACRNGVAKGLDASST